MVYFFYGFINILSIYLFTFTLVHVIFEPVRIDVCRALYMGKSLLMRIYYHLVVDMNACGGPGAVGVTVNAAVNEIGKMSSNSAYENLCSVLY